MRGPIFVGTLCSKLRAPSPVEGDRSLFGRDGSHCRPRTASNLGVCPFNLTSASLQRDREEDRKTGTLWPRSAHGPVEGGADEASIVELCSSHRIAERYNRRASIG